jgi:uncharacterized protein with PQ loop repeat
MASIIVTSLITALNTADIPLTTREGFSGALGSISLACWIFLLLPQLIENYRNGSAEAISLAFIFVWFIGDICNLAGALWAGLVPTVTAIAVYFCIADGVLIGQCLYYHIKIKREQGKQALRSDGIVEGPVGEEAPLLGRRRTESLTIPGSATRRRSSAASRRRSSVREDPLAKILEESDESGARLWFKNIFSILAIIAVGSCGWAIAYQSGVWKPSSEKHAADDESMAIGAQVLGYASAVAYLGARIPQIIKNAREKSCEGMPHSQKSCPKTMLTMPGLSLLFFILSVLGNATYGAGILFHSTERDYFLTNLPWLIGSLGTMAEDAMIFVQFHIYSSRASDSAIE